MPEVLNDPAALLPDFLDALARFMEAAVNAAYGAGAIVYTPAGSAPRSLWRNTVDEKNALDPFTVLRIYGGPPHTWAAQIPRINVQAQTVASGAAGDDAGMVQSQRLFSSLVDGNNRPMRMTPIMGGFLLPVAGFTTRYEVISIKPAGRPGLIGRDERGRGLFTWNFEAAFEAFYLAV